MIKFHLSRLLGERKWKQSDLARHTGIRPNTINILYNDLSERISFEHLDKICDALKCELTNLIEYIPNEINNEDNK